LAKSANKLLIFSYVYSTHISKQTYFVFRNLNDGGVLEISGGAMNEWLSEKSLDGVPLPPPPPPVQLSKIEPLEVQVEEDTMYVACRHCFHNQCKVIRCIKRVEITKFQQ
jgi:hypothetical protein